MSEWKRGDWRKHMQDVSDRTNLNFTLDDCDAALAHIEALELRLKSQQERALPERRHGESWSEYADRAWVAWAGSAPIENDLASGGRPARSQPRAETALDRLRNAANGPTALGVCLDMVEADDIREMLERVEMLEADLAAQRVHLNEHWSTPKVIDDPIRDVPRTPELEAAVQDWYQSFSSRGLVTSLAGLRDCTQASPCGNCRCCRAQD